MTTITEADIDELRKLGVQKERDSQEALRVANLLLAVADYLDTIRAECRTLGKKYKAAMGRNDRLEAELRSIVDDRCADAGSDGYVIASEALAAVDAVITTERRGDDVAMTIDRGTSIHECVFYGSDLESMTKPQLRGKISEVVERSYQETAGHPDRPTEWTAPCGLDGAHVDQRQGSPCPHCGDQRGHWPLESDRSEP